MKHFYTFITAVFLSTTGLIAQVTDVLTGSNFPVGIVLNGNDLYIAERNGGKIVKIDISLTTPSPVDVVTGLNNPSGMVLIGNDLYIAEDTGGKISKIDITVATPTVTQVISNITSPANLANIGNEVYVSLVLPKKISKFDITDQNPVLTDVLTEMSNNPFDLLINDNKMYISNGGNISTIDINSSTPVLNDIVTDMSSPRGMALKGNVLFFAQWTGQKISKTQVSTLSIVETIDSNAKMTLFPNPSADRIMISNIENNQDYIIYSEIGSQVKSGKVSNNEEIDLQNLKDGIYLLKFENGHSIKLVKE